MITLNPNLNKSQTKSAQKLINRFQKLQGHPNFPALERFAQKCIDDLTSTPAVAAIADVHMEIINDMSPAEFNEWANQYKEEDIA